MPENISTIRMGLIGKKYIDTILYVDAIFLGETTPVKKKRSTLGGFYNIVNSGVTGFEFCCYEQGIKEATIISEIIPSRRSSFTVDVGVPPPIKVDFDKHDWLHIAYVDDIPPNLLTKEFFKTKISLDFCTTSDRELYKNIMKQSTLVFDSRERKYLYKNIIIDTPIVFHDARGCECIINGETIHSASVNTLDNVNVNGSGDVFAAFFIRELLLKNDIKIATDNAATLTTSWLEELN
jgi:uncharacterized pyridoxamine 5'-phosphate oxidase family protein